MFPLNAPDMYARVNEQHQRPSHLANIRPHMSKVSQTNVLEH